MDNLIIFFFKLFGVIIFITVLLILIYYILPKNYELIDNREDLKNEKNITINPNNEFIIEYDIFKIDKKIPLIFENNLKSEKIINNPNKVIVKPKNVLCKIINSTNENLIFKINF